MKKTIFSRLMAFTLAIASSFSFYAKAEKPLFPTGSYTIYNVAIIGSDIEGGKVIEESPDFNKNMISNLCNVGTRLENFAGVKVLSENKISLAGRELPRTSMIMQEERTIFCFYDVANVYTNPEVIKECLFAICPYTLNLEESYDAWTTRMTRLRDFVKTRNKMCDLRFFGIINGDFTEEVGKYTIDTEQIACKILDIYDFAQTVSSNWANCKDDYHELIEDFIGWGGSSRKREFKQCMVKSVPTITNRLGTSPEFHQEEGENLISMPPVVPKFQSTQSVAPTSVPTSEGAKKKSGQMVVFIDSSRDDYTFYWNCLRDCGDEKVPLMSDVADVLGVFDVFKIFEKMVNTFIEDDFRSNEIIDCFRNIKFDGHYLKTEIEEFRFCDRGKKYSSPKEAYSDIFRDEGVRKAFEQAFTKFDDMNKMKCALLDLRISPRKKGYIRWYRTIESSKRIM